MPTRPIWGAQEEEPYDHGRPSRAKWAKGQNFSDANDNPTRVLGGNAEWQSNNSFVQGTDLSSAGYGRGTQRFDAISPSEVKVFQPAQFGGG